MGAAQITKEVYEPRKIESLFQILSSSLNNSGKYKEYEIQIDDLPVIPRNNDPNRFMDYSDYVDSKSNCVSIILYLTNNKTDKFNFYFTPESLRASIKQGLQGLADKQETPPINAEELIARGRREAEFENLIKENQTLKEDIKAYQKDLEKLLNDLDEATEKNDDGLMKYLPLISELKGLIRPANNGDLSGTPEKNANQSKGSFQRKPDAENAEGEPMVLTERQKGHLRFIESIRQRIGDLQMANVIHLIDLCATDPEGVPFAMKMLTRYLQDKKNAKQNNNNGKEKI